MILILLIGLVFVAVSFGLFARSLLLPRMRREEALQQIAGYGFAADGAQVQKQSAPSRLGAKASVDAMANPTSLRYFIELANTFKQTNR